MEALTDDTARHSRSRPSIRSDGLSLAQRLDRACMMGLVVAKADAHKVSVSDVLGARRTAIVSEARRSIMREMRALGMSLPKIGYLLGRHHTTVLSAVNEVRAQKQAERGRVAWRRRQLAAETGASA